MTLVLPPDWNQELLAVLARPNVVAQLVDNNNRTSLLTKIDPNKMWLPGADFLQYLVQNPVILAQIVMIINQSHLNVSKSSSDYIQFYGNIRAGKYTAQVNAFGSQVNVYGSTPTQLPIQPYGSQVQYYTAPAPICYPQPQPYYPQAPQAPVSNVFYGNYPSTFTTTTPYSVSTFVPAAPPASTYPVPYPPSQPAPRYY